MLPAVKNALFVLGAALFMSAACAQPASDPWKPAQLMAPDELAAVIRKGASPAPLVLSIGPGALIKGSEDIGPAGTAANFDKLKKRLSREPRNRDIVIYCGCCPFKNCPNVRPAFEQLGKMAFTRYRLLNLATNLKTDWLDHGYPTQ